MLCCDRSCYCSDVCHLRGDVRTTRPPRRCCCTTCPAADDVPPLLKMLKDGTDVDEGQEAAARPGARDDCGQTRRAAAGLGARQRLGFSVFFLFFKIHSRSGGQLEPFLLKISREAVHNIYCSCSGHNRNGAITVRCTIVVRSCRDHSL